MSTLKQRAEAVAVLDAKRTPGNWENGSALFVRDAKGNTICDSCSFHVSREERKSNGDFIARAPEMAALIADALAEIDRMSAKVFAMADVCSLASELSLLWGDADSDEESDGDDAGFIEQMDLLRSATREYRSQMLAAPIPTNTEAGSNG